MSQKTSGRLVLVGIVGLLLGVLLYLFGSMSPNARPCDGACVRPFLSDLAYYGGEILVVAAVIGLLALGVWQLRHRPNSISRTPNAAFNRPARVDRAGHPPEK